MSDLSYIPAPPKNYSLIRKLIGDRYAWNFRTLSWNTNEQQKTALRDFEAAIQNGEIRFEWHPCFCGGRRFYLISEFDRYALPVQTLMCRDCGMVQTNPWMDNKSKTIFYRDYYRRIYAGRAYADETDFDKMYTRGKNILQLFSDHAIQPGNTVYEIGCGTGGILKAFAESGYQVAGCDYGNDFLEIGRKAGLQLYEGDSSVLENKGKADLVILSHVMEHFSEIRPEIEKIRTLLSDSGMIYIEVPNITHLYDGYRNNLMCYFQNAHNWSFYPYGLDRIMRALGFERLVMHSTGFLKSVFTIGRRQSGKRLIKRAGRFVKRIFRSIRHADSEETTLMLERLQAIEQHYAPDHAE